MYLSKAIGIDLIGGKILGLMDGAQAIVLTLLVIELPELIIEALEHTNNTTTLAFTISTDLIGYLTAALVIFDIWSLQKATIESTKPSRVQALTCIITLWISSLVTVFFFLTEKFATDSFAETLSHDGESHFPELLLFRAILIVITGVVYNLNNMYTANSAEATNKAEARYVRSLSKIRSISLTFILLISLAFASDFGITYALIPLIMFIPVIFIEPKTSPSRMG